MTGLWRRRCADFYGPGVPECRAAGRGEVHGSQRDANYDWIRRGEVRELVGLPGFFGQL